LNRSTETATRKGISMRGTVKNLNAERGFGFIRGENGTEYFFHRSGVTGVRFEGLRQNDTVEFEVEDSPKGPRAAQISRVEG
jgi:CspA family cold shock protein